MPTDHPQRTKLLLCQQNYRRANGHPDSDFTEKEKDYADDLHNHPEKRIETQFPALVKETFRDFCRHEYGTDHTRWPNKEDAQYKYDRINYRSYIMDDAKKVWDSLLNPETKTSAGKLPVVDYGTDSDNDSDQSANEASTSHQDQDTSGPSAL